MDAFLSCLCGSEPCRAAPSGGRLFLSCLCGSERRGGVGLLGGFFLSCLCGSEPAEAGPAASATFLSCLCGSELGGGRRCDGPGLSELPMRQ